MPPRSAKQENKSDVLVHDDHDVPPVANGTHVLMQDKQNPLRVLDSIPLPRLPVTSRSKSYPLSTTHPGSMVTNFSSEAPIPLKRKREVANREAEKSRSSVPEKTIELTASRKDKTLSNYAQIRERSRQRVNRVVSTESGPNSISVRELGTSSNRNNSKELHPRMPVRQKGVSEVRDVSGMPSIHAGTNDVYSEQLPLTHQYFLESQTYNPQLPSAFVPPLPPLIRVEDITNPTEPPIYQMPYGYLPFFLPVPQFGMTPYGLPCHNSAEHPDSALSHPSLDPLARSLYPSP